MTLSRPSEEILAALLEECDPSKVVENNVSSCIYKDISTCKEARLTILSSRDVGRPSRTSSPV
jgi:hypothetical protein